MRRAIGGHIASPSETLLRLAKSAMHSGQVVDASLLSGDVVVRRSTS
jgi:hypothetical protein